MSEARPDPVDAGTVAVGDTAPELVVENVDREDFVKYAGASGDFSRLHYDEPYATSLGNESVFAQGMLTAGYASHLVSDWLGLERITGFRVRFSDRVWPGDTVTASGEVTAVSETDAGVRVEASIRVTTQDGTVALTGDVTAVLPTDES